MSLIKLKPNANLLGVVCPSCKRILVFKKMALIRGVLLTAMTEDGIAQVAACSIVCQCQNVMTFVEEEIDG